MKNHLFKVNRREIEHSQFCTDVSSLSIKYDSPLTFKEALKLNIIKNYLAKIFPNTEFLVKYKAKGTNSVIFDLHVNNGSQVKKLIIKKYISEFAKSKSEEEFKNLNFLEKIGFPVPKAYAFNCSVPFLVMEQVEGVTIYELIKKGDVQQTKAVIAELAKLLVELHAHGLTHSDATMKNVILTNDGIKIIDWQSMEQGSTLNEVAFVYYDILFSCNLSKLLHRKGYVFANYFLKKYLKNVNYAVDVSSLKESLRNELHERFLKAEFLSKQMLNPCYTAKLYSKQFVFLSPLLCLYPLFSYFLISSTSNLNVEQFLLNGVNN
jgi:tRNA A-37 threonylcarbamoyl transferase component Bud32